MNDQSRHYEIKNELANIKSSVNGVDKQIYDLKKDVDLILEWCCVAGVAVCIVAFVLVVGALIVLVLATRG